MASISFELELGGLHRFAGRHVEDAYLSDAFVWAGGRDELYLGSCSCEHHHGLRLAAAQMVGSSRSFATLDLLPALIGVRGASAVFVLANLPRRRGSVGR